ncbi:MAG: sulfotransferase domain-containing protein [Anaerolineales bacterium]|nr:sulfotransferase domain-containing protein [Anaerolineales bacterium]
MMKTGKALYYEAKYWLQWARLQERRLTTARRWGTKSLHQMPIVFGTVMAKAGSHLLIQVLRALPQLGPFVDGNFPPINRTMNNAKLPTKDILVRLRRLRSGEIANGFLPCREPYLSLLTSPSWATVFVYRDPRDLIISRILYITDMRENHAMHAYFTQTLHSMDERIKTTIHGLPEMGWDSVRERYKSYMGWLDQPHVLSLRFEDLILDRDETLLILLNYLTAFGFTPRISSQEAVETLKRAIQPSKSPTFRKGQPGNWREYFTDEHKQMFKEATGDLVVRLGYERDTNW